MTASERLTKLTHEKITEYDTASAELHELYQTKNISFSAIGIKKKHVEQLHDDVVDCQIRLVAAIDLGPIFEALDGL